MKPTGWFLYHHIDPDDRTVTVWSAARWYSPGSTRCEVNNRDGKGWVEQRILLDLNEDPGWRFSTEADVDAWLASEPELLAGG